MSSEKNYISITTLESLIPHIPGSVSLYDSDDKNQIVSRPTSILDLKQTFPTFTEVSIENLLDQGVQIVQSNQGPKIQFRYPKVQQTLQSFIGTLPAYSLIFTNPSEDPKQHSFELTTEVYKTTNDIVFTPETPSYITVLRVIDGKPQEISRLGHLIALNPLQAKKTIFPPADLKLYLPPVHIPSQHLGDCAADSIQTLLFYSERLQPIYAGVANELYKKFIQSDKSVLFAVDSTRLVEAIREVFKLSVGNQEQEDILYIFASMVRRYILIRLLDFGTPEEIESLRIPQTKCILPSAVPQIGKIPGRRRSINLLAGSTIALRLTRLFEKTESFLTADLKLDSPKLTLVREHLYYCMLFKLLHHTSFHSIITETKKSYAPPCLNNQIVAMSFAVHVSKWDEGAKRHDESGHSFAIFLFQEKWYLQDDNLGIAYPIPKFSIDDCIKVKGYFFIGSYEQLLSKTQLIEENYFTQQQLQAGKANTYGFYGYRYVTGKQVKQVLLAVIPNASYQGTFLEGYQRLYLCTGDVDKTKKPGVIFCESDLSELKAPVKPVVVKTVKELPESILSQIDVNFRSATVQTKNKGDIRNLRKNIQVNLNSFTNTTRKKNTGVSINTRKVRNRNAAIIESQLNSF